MQFFGIIFLITTTLICLCKKEKPPDPESQRSFEDKLTVKETYNIVFNLFKLYSVRKLIIVLLSSKVNRVLKKNEILLKLKIF